MAQFADVLSSDYGSYGSLSPGASIAPAASNDTERGDNPLSLGSAWFTAAECPEHIEFGLSQAQATHRFIGGGVAIQTLGPQPHDVEWEGLLRGPTVLARARLLKRLCSQGQVLPLTYIDESYDVVILAVTISYLRAGRADYKITVRVLRDTSGSYASGAAASIDTQASALFNGAQTSSTTLLSVDPAASVLQEPISSLGIGLANAGPLAQITGSTASSLIQQAQIAVAAAQNYAATLGLSTNFGQIATALELVSQLQCLTKNIQNGQAPRMDVGMGVDFWDLSSKWYGTPDYAQALAEANGRMSPVVAPGETVRAIIPPLASIGRG